MRWSERTVATQSNRKPASFALALAAATCSGAHAHHDADFLREQLGQRIGAYRNVQAATAGERHLGKRRHQTAVRAVVAAGEPAVAARMPDPLEQGPQFAGIVDVRRLLGIERTPALRQCGGAEPPLLGEWRRHEKQRLRAVRDFRRQPQARVGHRREGADDERHRRQHHLLVLAAPPRRAHGEAVLADRNGDAEGRTQFFAHGANRLEQRLVFPLVAGGGHPIGRKHDAA